MREPGCACTIVAQGNAAAALLRLPNGEGTFFS